MTCVFLLANRCFYALLSYSADYTYAADIGTGRVQWVVYI